jgi:invasion protein IalB
LNISYYFAFSEGLGKSAPLGYHYGIMKKKIFYVLCLTLVFFLPNSNHAKGSGLIDVYGDWSAFSIKQDRTNVCFLGSEATESEGKYSKRGDVLFMVTHRPAQKEFSIINFQTGYTFKPGMDAVITIGDHNFSLFTQGSDGWAKDSETDKSIVKSMIRGSQMVIKGTSSRGTQTTDTFSLKGFTAAYKAASKACKI